METPDSWSRDQLARLYGDYLSAISPVNNGKLGISGAFTIVRQYFPIIKKVNVAKAIRHFANGYTVNFDQFTQMMWFFFKEYTGEGGKYNYKTAQAAIMNVLRDTKEHFCSSFEDDFYRSLKDSTKLGQHMKDLLRRLKEGENFEHSDIEFLVFPEKLKYLKKKDNKDGDKEMPNEDCISIHVHIKTLQFSKLPIKLQENSKYDVYAVIEVLGRKERTHLATPSEVGANCVTISDVKVFEVNVTLIPELKSNPEEEKTKHFVRMNMMRETVKVTVVLVFQNNDSTEEFPIGYTTVPLAHLLFAAPHQINMKPNLVPLFVSEDVIESYKMEFEEKQRKESTEEEKKELEQKYREMYKGLINKDPTINMQLSLSLSAKGDPAIWHPDTMDTKEHDELRILKDKIQLRYGNRELHTRVYAVTSDKQQQGQDGKRISCVTEKLTSADKFLDHEFKSFMKNFDIGEEDVWPLVRIEARRPEPESICVNSFNFLFRLGTKLSQYERCMLVLFTRDKAQIGEGDAPQNLLVCGHVNMCPFYCIGQIKKPAKGTSSQDEVTLISVDEVNIIPDDFLVETVIRRDTCRYCVYINIQEHTCLQKVNWNTEDPNLWYCYTKVKTDTSKSTVDQGAPKRVFTISKIDNQSDQSDNHTSDTLRHVKFSPIRILADGAPANIEWYYTL